MKDNKVLLEQLFKDRTDSGIPEFPEDLFTHDLYSEVALEILYGMMVASGCWNEED
ncbi:hypothetical protein VP501E541_P0194 [Vibrio phage 501E54-1]|nr:hypothetical protein VP501E541_P0194 [Vibrio phage 501E54-1]